MARPSLYASLGSRTARGFVWLVAQTVGSKVVSVCGQIALAWYLRPEDFGLVGLAYTVAAIAGLVRQSGLKEILVQRQLQFSRWANAAFWMSIALGILAALLMLAAAPLAARLYDAPHLTRMIAILAIAVPIEMLSVVPDAVLNIRLRFRAIAIVSFVGATATMALTVWFAARGFGADSFVLPRPIVALGHAAILWSIARPRIRCRFQMRLWKSLLSDSGLIISAWICYTILAVGDYSILGLWHSTHVVGIYYFAFNLSRQPLSLFTVSLFGVLMPSLTTLQGQPDRQLNAFLAASRMLAVIGVPLSLLQAVLAEPLIRIFFGDRWAAAVPVLQVLTLGMTLMMVGAPGMSLLQARGEFRTMLGVVAACTPVFLVLVLTTAYFGAALAVAMGVAVFYGFYGPVNLYAAVRSLGGGWRDVYRIYAVAFPPAVLSTGAAYIVGWYLAHGGEHQPFRLLVSILCGLLLYPALLRILAPRVWQELLHRIRGALPARIANIV